MGTSRLIPLVVGDLHVPRSLLLDHRGPDDPVHAPAVMWYVEADDQRLVIDTGPGDAEAAHRKGRTHYSRSPSQHPTARLASLGVTAESIDVVVLTHLHWDHSSDLDLYPGAEIVAQRADLPFSVDPIPEQKAAFDLDVLTALEAHAARIIEGDEPLSPSVTVLHTPGHTPGSQSVVVGANGQQSYVVAGDTIPLADNVRHGLVANGIRSDRAALLRSLERLSALDAILLPSHDPLIADFDGVDLVKNKEHLCNALK